MFAFLIVLWGCSNIIQCYSADFNTFFHVTHVDNFVSPFHVRASALKSVNLGSILWPSQTKRLKYLVFTAFLIDVQHKKEKV